MAADSTRRRTRSTDLRLEIDRINKPRGYLRAFDDGQRGDLHATRVRRRARAGLVVRQEDDTNASDRDCRQRNDHLFRPPLRPSGWDLGNDHRDPRGVLLKSRMVGLTT